MPSLLKRRSKFNKKNALNTFSVCGFVEVIFKGDIICYKRKFFMNKLEADEITMTSI